MREHNTTAGPSVQDHHPVKVISPDDLFDPHAERVLLGAALRSGSPRGLGGLGPQHFYDPLHKIIVHSIQKFQGRRFGIPQLAALLPTFLIPYLEVLVRYEVLVAIGERSRN
jgi:hypothetical protein